MGWTSYHASHYDSRWNVDRKAECDAYFMEGLNRGHYNVKKSAMRGSVYYAAVENLVRYAGRDENGEAIYKSVPENARKTWAAVFLTSVDSRDYFNFSYKDMDESMGPCECDCPLSILNMLSPTEDEWALAWRQRCREKAQDKNTLGKLPIGSIIEYEWQGKKQQAVKRDPAYQFKTPWWGIVGTSYYIKKNHIPKSYRVVSAGASA